VDAVGLLEGSKAWTEADGRSLQDWFSRFLQWMQESKNGREEAAARNNHGTYYDAQVVSFALFVGKTDVAARVLQDARLKRVAAQIEPDGRQPLELERTNGWSYSVMNLEGLMTLARLGEHAGVDLWRYQTADGRGIRKALDHLVPFALGEKKWAHQQIGPWDPQALYPLVRLAARRFPDAYRALLSKLPVEDPAGRSRLLLSPAAQAPVNRRKIRPLDQDGVRP
jgi:hypothetical protein